ncbi:MAG: NAD-dependent epimerase/dehydratase family protein, partial [Chthoniobacterales bacterium]
ARVVVLSRDPQRFAASAPHLAREAGIMFVRGDVQTLDARSVLDQLAESSPDQFAFVIHAATEASAKLNSENPLLMVDTIVQGTRAALDFAAAVGAKRFLLTSSGAVYGPQPPHVTHVQEDYLGAPDQTDTASAYGEGKRLAELLCVCFAKQYSIEPALARCFAFVGPFLPLDAHFAIGNFIRDAIRGGPIRVGGDGTPYRSYLYTADLAVWLWTMLVKARACRPYNVGSSEELNIGEIAEQVRTEVCPEAVVDIAQQPRAGGVPGRYVPATDRAERELGLRSRVSLGDAIRRTARYARDEASTATHR